MIERLRAVALRICMTEDSALHYASQDGHVNIV